MRILITGATSGLGFDLAEKLAIRKHTVYVTTHNSKEVETVKDKLKEKEYDMICFKLDITDTNDIKLIEGMEIDVLVLNAAIANGGSILDMDDDKLKENYDVNVFANCSIIKRFYHANKKRKTPTKIFVISSLVSNIPIPYIGCYSSSKAALSMLTFTLKKELEYLTDNISISLVEPGAIRTGFNQYMIDNKEENTYKDSKISQNIESINRLQRNFFAMIESSNYSKTTNKIVREIEKDNPKFLIRSSLLQTVLIRLYLLFNR